MTLSHEERAEAVAQRMHPLGPKKAQVMMGRDSFVALIAQALRQACNEKLEEAAILADEHDLGGSVRGAYDRGADATARKIAAEIRDLKDAIP